MIYKHRIVLSVARKMKQILVVAIFSLCFSTFSFAQSAGINAALIGSTIHYPQLGNYYINPRPMGKTNGFSPGLRLEGNLMTPERKIFNYNAIGVSYYFPRRDSTYYFLELTSDSALLVFGTFKTTSMQVSIKSAWNIPFHFEFLTIHVGIGYGLARYKTQLVLPDKSDSFNYDKSDFRGYYFEPKKSYGSTTELLAGGLYEFEKFYILAQYSLIFETINSTEPAVRNGLHVGIYYPLIRL